MSRQKEQLPVKEVTEHFISGQDRKKKGRERIETTREGKEPRLKKDKRTKRKTCRFSAPKELQKASASRVSDPRMSASTPAAVCG